MFEYYFYQIVLRQVSNADPEPEKLVMHGAETDRELLDRLFACAVEKDHPGIDQKGIDRMNEFIESGRFTYGSSHSLLSFCRC